MCDALRILRVSVPLRGCGFEISEEFTKYDVFALVFPSPCGDVVLKLELFEPVDKAGDCFRPLTGMWF